MRRWSKKRRSRINLKFETKTLVSDSSIKNPYTSIRPSDNLYHDLRSDSEQPFLIDFFGKDKAPSTFISLGPDSSPMTEHYCFRTRIIQSMDKN